jgi:hypothetical protein
MSMTIAAVGERVAVLLWSQTPSAAIALIVQYVSARAFGRYAGAVKHTVGAA